MVEVGRFSAELRLWSLISGPIQIPSVELADVSVLLEEGRKERVTGSSVKQAFPRRSLSASAPKPPRFPRSL